MFHLHLIVTQMAAMVGSKISGQIKKHNILREGEGMVDGQTEDDAVFLGENRWVAAAAGQIRLFSDQKCRRAGKRISNRLIERFFHDLEDEGGSLPVDSEFCIHILQHPAVAVNEGDAR